MSLSAGPPACNTSLIAPVRRFVLDKIGIVSTLKCDTETRFGYLVGMSFSGSHVGDLGVGKDLKCFSPSAGMSVASPQQLVSARPVPLDRYTSALEQVQPMIAEHSLAAWSSALNGQRPVESRSELELAALLLAVNYELLGYPPEHAWLLAQRGEEATPGRLDG